MTALWVTGRTLEVARQLPDACVDLIVTSPPFLALRSYLPADDPAKQYEIGQEATPGAFLDVLLDLVEEWRRILTPHGSLCVELGDTYSGSGGAGGDYSDEGLREGQPVFKQQRQPFGDWPLDKSLCLIPQLFAIALSYGRNPLTGRTVEPWRVRNIIRWVRPNPPVGALGDKFRPATSEITVACVGASRYFDLDAVRHQPKSGEAGEQLAPSRSVMGYSGRDKPGAPGAPDQPQLASHPAGAPPLDWWEIPTHPYKGSHYATFPPALVVKPVEAMCPRQVCTTCGQPSTRITSEPEYVKPDGSLHEFHGDGFETNESMANRRKVTGADNGNMARSVETLGWSDCGHDAWRAGRVLDPFGGSGTTLSVAVGHGRTGIGIDLDARNVELARERVGPMFFTELTAGELAAELAPNEEAAA